MSDVKVTLVWTEANPGWVAAAAMTTYEEVGERGVAIIERTASSEVIDANPLHPIIDVLDLLARKANVHPAGLGKVQVSFDAESLYEIKGRACLR